MRWNPWFTWSAATVLILLYVSAGAVASRSEAISITLSPGCSTELRIFRLAEDVLRMSLEFDGGDKPRPELGVHRAEDWRKAGLLKFIEPGSAVRIVASTPETPRVTYEAMPNSTVYPVSLAIRDLVPGKSLSPGVGSGLQPETDFRFIVEAVSQFVFVRCICDQGALAPLITRSRGASGRWVSFLRSMLLPNGVLAGCCWRGRTRARRRGPWRCRARSIV